MEILQVKDLKLYYKTLYGMAKAVDGVSFTVRKGETLGIAGESGCGKTTLGLGLVLRKPPMVWCGGQAFIEDTDLMNLDEKSMRKLRYEKISIIPQYAMDALNPTKKIRQIIQDLLKEHKQRYEEKQELLTERLTLINLNKKILDMYPIELSGGMRQRLVMVISTLLNPKLLISDEITSALDVSTQKTVIQTLYQMKKKGFMDSLIFITHDLSLLYQIADRVMIMYAGKVAEIGEIQDIVDNPLHPYTRALIGSLPRIGVRYHETKLKGIHGYPPNLLKIGPACRFKERCPMAFNKCEENPPIFRVNAQEVACWLYEEGERV
ncbi:MAG TPA: ABC transporter ATP-binding protein [Pseudothermotoga sp.]|nr:ABC transporter ATP-binding protein [Pseudothermotoga sp.]HOK83263.1 ABC transporter ATP-binding protein [Pseudothermotoga sp.]HPP70089.1 ABC transporter ATP-binding protein [Pseudothermotoga sp.]